MNSPKFGIVVFPGSNCDHDAYYALGKLLGYHTNFLWHKEGDLKESDVIVLPGGFSYGDYLRTGSIARFSPIMNEVISFAKKGGIIIGICNGFQILLEAGLLPGIMLKNISLNFVCKDVYLSVENRETNFTKGIETESALKVPVAHGEGNYFADKDTLQELVSTNYIEELPMDPYSDRPLVYKRMDGDFILYSLGADFDDDGGISSKWGEGEQGGDHLFWPVEHRYI